MTGLAQVVLLPLSHMFSVDALDCACMSHEVYLPHTNAHPVVFAQQPFPIPFVLDETASFGPHTLLLRRADLWLSCCSVWPVYVANPSGGFCLGSATLPLVVLEACWTLAVMSEFSCLVDVVLGCFSDIVLVYSWSLTEQDRGLSAITCIY